MWVDDDGFIPLVKKVLQYPIQGCAMFRSTSILKHLKKELKLLDGDVYMKLDEQVSAAKENLDKAQLDLHDKPFDVVAKLNAQVTFDAYIVLSTRQMSLLRQKAKVQWLQDGDSNSAYFHVVINWRKKANNI